MSEQLKAPMPYFGGKSKICDTVWSAFGAAVDNYVEPFCGSAAMLLGRPAFDPEQHVETINDADGFVANFWRAMSVAPEEVAFHAEWPVNECDLHARHLWLVRQRKELTAKLCGDPEWFDAKAAGWWVWGLCSWIGSGWCSGEGPWTEENGELVLGYAVQGLSDDEDVEDSRGNANRARETIWFSPHCLAPPQMDLFSKGVRPDE